MQLLAVIALAGLALAGRPRGYSDAGATLFRLVRSGDLIDGKPFGQVRDINGEPIMQFGENNAKGSAPDISNYEDFTSMIEVKDSIYTCTHFELNNPASVQCLKNKVNRDGTLTPQTLSTVDFSAFGGLWNPCSGSVSPWKTHLGGEEYDPDARLWADMDDDSSLLETNWYTGSWSIDQFMRYWNVYNVSDGKYTIGEARKLFRPYNYGWIFEVSIDAETEAISATKHYAMGRIAFELAQCRNTATNTVCYMTDDGNAVSFLKFVSDKVGDLSAGTLYAAKFTQNSPAGSAAAESSFNIEWIDLGHATSAEVKEALDSKVGFYDIFDVVVPPASTLACPQGYKHVHNGGRYWSSSTNTSVAECLKVKEGMEMIASRLETRRYLQLKGATAELTKAEGLAISPNGKMMVMATSVIGGAMLTKNKYEAGGPDSIQLAYNGCGCIWSFDLDADFGTSKMDALLCGTSDAADVDPARPYGCSLSGISEPDNLAFMTDDSLLIAEDTSGHQNDMVWVYKLADKSLTRVATMPYGSEAAGVYFHPDLKGFSYMIFATQHPFDSYEYDSDKLESPEEMEGAIDMLVWDSVRRPLGSDYEFDEVPVPVTDAEKRDTTITGAVRYKKVKKVKPSKPSKN